MNVAKIGNKIIPAVIITSAMAVENVKITSGDLNNAISEPEQKNKKKSSIGFNKTISC